jgi:hypothetical protein
MEFDIRTEAELQTALAVDRATLVLLDGSFNISIRDDRTIEVYSTLLVTIEARDSSQPRVVARDSSQPRVVALGSSQPRVEALDSSQPRVEALDSSQPRVVARHSSQPRVVARHSSQPRVVALDSSQPRVVALDSSQPRVVACGSSQPRVEALDSSQPRVVARGYVQLSVSGAVIAECSEHVSVLIAGVTARITGGNQQRIDITSPRDWCDYHGVHADDDVALVYKGLSDDLTSDRGTQYIPGSTVTADSWDELECGHGLHFVPAPAMARKFTDATRFVACEVRLCDMLVFPSGAYPFKVKAPTCRVLYEVDQYGEEVA